MSRAAETARRRRQHRAPSATRSQLLVGAAAVVATALLVSPLTAVGAGQAETGAQTWTAGEVVAADAFDGRASLGSAPSGGTYDARATTGVSVGLRDGQLEAGGLRARSSYRAVLPEVSVRDVELSHTATAVLDGAGRGLYETAMVRVQGDRSHYGATVVMGSTGAVLRIDRVLGSTATVLSRVPLPGVTAGRPAVIELRAAGGGPVSLQARAWPAGSSAPAWQLTTTDSSAEAIRGAGAVGVSGYFSELGGTAAVRVDDLRASRLTATSAEPSAAPSTAPSTAPPAAPTTAPSTAQPAVTTQPPTIVPAATTTTTSTAGFAHPGIVVGADQLASVRRHIAAGDQPWRSAYDAARWSSYGNLNYTAAPVAVVACPSGGSTTCRRETDDATAAYTHALLWQLNGDRRHAAKAIEILDAWSGTLQSYPFDTRTNVNGKLQAAWAAELYTKAAELVRSSDAGWAPARVDRFKTMLRTIHLPAVKDGWTGGGANWQLSMAEATMNIGVFLDDRAVFNDGVADWRAQVPAAIYLRSDGAAPLVPPNTFIKAASLQQYWYQPLRFVDGLEQESCRDSSHAALGLGAALNAAETASIQGVDLYGEQRTRLTAAMELQSRYLLDPQAPGWPCAKLTASSQGARAVFEIGYQHYAGQGASLPATRAWLARNRPTSVLKHITWETLTHGS